MTPTGTFRISQKDPYHRLSVHGKFVDSRGRVARSSVSTKVDSAPRDALPWRADEVVHAAHGQWLRDACGHPAGLSRLPTGAPAPADIAPLIYQKVGIGTLAVIES